MEAEPLLQSSASADRAVSPTRRRSPDGTAPVATGLSSALPGTAYLIVGRSLMPNSARLGRERWSAGARTRWRDVPARESWGSCPCLEAGNAGLGHARQLPLGQAEFLPPPHHFGQPETQAGLLIRLSCRWAFHPGCPRLGQGGALSRSPRSLLLIFIGWPSRWQRAAVPG
jgi:hypothetical protein